MSQECLRSLRHSFSVSIAPSLRGFGSKLQSDAGSETSRAGGALGSLLGKTMLVGFAAVGVAAAVGKGLYDIGSTFDDISDTIRINTGKSGAALDALTASAENVGKRAPVALESIAPVLSSISDRLGLTGKPLENLTTQFLDLGHILGQDVDVDTVTKSFAAFGIKGADTSKALDQIFRVTQSTGIGFDTLTSSLTRNGPVLSQFGFSLNQSASLIGSLDKAGLDSNKTLASLSKAMATFAKAGQDPRKALLGTISQIQAFVKVGDQVGAVNLASKVFGTRGATQFVAAVKAGKLNVDSLTAATKGNSDTIIAATKDTSDFAEAFQLFKNKALIAVEPIATRVFNSLSLGLQALSQGGALKAATTGLSTLGATFMGVFNPIAASLLPRVSAAIKVLAPSISTLVASVGGALLTAFSNLVVVLSPLLTDLANLGATVLPPVAAALTLVGGALTVVTGFLAQHGTAVRGVVVVVGAMVVAFQAYQAALAVVRIATAAFTVVQGLLNVVLTANPIGVVVLALVGLAAGLVYAYKKSDTFRAIVDGAFKGIKKVVSSVINFIVPFVKAHWGLLVSIIGGPVGIVVVQIIKHFGTIKSVVGAVATFVVNSAKKYGEFVSAVISKMGQVVAFFKAFPGKIKAFLNALIGDMKRIGGEIVAGLLKGIQAGAGAVLAYAGQLAQKIKDKLKSALHINSPSKDTIPMGASVAEGLVVGMKEGTPGVEKAAKKMAEKMKAAIDKATQTLTDRRDTLQGLFDGIASGVTSNLGANVFDGVKTAAAFVGSLLNAKSGMNNLLAAFNTLKSYGLDPGFLSQLFQSGGADLILSLAAGGQDQATVAANLFGDVNGLTADLSNRVAKNDPVSDRLDTTNTLLRQLVDASGKTAYDLAQAVNGAAGKGHSRGKKGGKRN